jgi:hypothetical protein
MFEFVYVCVCIYVYAPLYRLNGLTDFIRILCFKSLSVLDIYEYSISKIGTHNIGHNKRNGDFLKMALMILIYFSNLWSSSPQISLHSIITVNALRAQPQNAAVVDIAFTGRTNFIVIRNLVTKTE